MLVLHVVCPAEWMTLSRHVSKKRAEAATRSVVNTKLNVVYRVGVGRGGSDGATPCSVCTEGGQYGWWGAAALPHPLALSLSPHSPGRGNCPRVAQRLRHSAFPSSPSSSENDTLLNLDSLLGRSYENQGYSHHNRIWDVAVSFKEIPIRKLTQAMTFDLHGDILVFWDTYLFFYDWGILGEWGWVYNDCEWM